MLGHDYLPVDDNVDNHVADRWCDDVGRLELFFRHDEQRAPTDIGALG